MRSSMTMLMVLLAGVSAGADVSAKVTYIAAADVSAAFVQGRPLVETPAYKVHASRREAEGMAEVHVRDTDIIYVLDGSASIVTGGQVIEGKVTAIDEIRGRGIAGGTSQRLVKGEVFIVPNGVPHWFRDVQSPFIYYVVKTTSQDGGTR